ncbi:MAG: hypothetical protein K1X57_09295 [Gemmataceae bacterium]|nr:hypothetical protein [Gemmataceae bacterium]
MKHIDTILTDIAVKHLRIPTLAERHSDSLDFHCVSVWGIRDALRAAFDAGATSALSRPVPEQGLPIPYDAYEIEGVASFVDEHDTYYEPTEDADAEMWTLYGHIPGRGVEAIGDFRTREHAEEVFARITGRRYRDGTKS